MLQTQVDVWMSGVDEVGPVSLVAQWEPSRNEQKYAASSLRKAHSYTYKQIHKYKYTKTPKYTRLVAQWKPSRNGQTYIALPLSEAQLIFIYTNTNIYTYTQNYTNYTAEPLMQ